MSQVRPTKAVTITNDEAYDLAGHLARLGDSLRVIIPIVSQAEQDGLAAAFGGTIPVPSFISRTDKTDSPVYRWDGTVWTQISGRQHAEFSGPAFTTTGGTGVNWGGPAAGLFSASAGQTFNNDFVQPDAAGRIKLLLTGTYALSGIILPTTVPASYSLQIVDITSGAILGDNSGVGYGDKEQTVTAPNHYLVANTVVEFRLVISNAVTIGSRIRVTKYQ